MLPRKNTILLATGLALLSLIAIHGFKVYKQHQAVSLSTEGFPVIGEKGAKIELVLFEDLRCSGCQYFEQVIFPQIEEEYIKTGKARLALVLLAFLDNSKFVANAAWAVFEQNPQLFFPYVNELFEHNLNEVLGPETLIEAARKIGGIDTEKLSACIRSECYYGVLDQNLEWAQKIMKKDFGTPALYINGIRVSARSFKAIQEQIEKL